MRTPYVITLSLAIFCLGAILPDLIFGRDNDVYKSFRESCKAGDFRRALDLYKELLKDDPYNSRTEHSLSFLIEQVFLKKKVDDFEALVRGWAKSEAENEWPHLVLGRLYEYKRNDEGQLLTPESEEEYMSAADINPDNPECYCGLGRLCLTQRKYMLALEQYKMALEVHEGYIPAKVGVVRASLLKELKKREQGLARNIIFNPDNPEKGITLDFKKYKRMTQELKTILDTEPENVDAWIALGEVYTTIRDLALELEDAPNTRIAGTDLGITEFAFQENVEAINAYNKAFELDPDYYGFFPWLPYNRQEVFSKIGHFGARAIPIAAKALDHKDPMIRQEAIEILSEFIDSILTRVEKKIDDEEEPTNVRSSALRLMLRYKRNFILSLTQREKYRFTDCRKSILTGIGEALLEAQRFENMRSELMAMLLNGLRDEDANVRACVAIYLGKLGDRKAIPALLRIVNDDENGYVRYLSAAALLKITGQMAEVNEIASPEQQAEVIKRWQEWWRKNRISIHK